MYIVALHGAYMRFCVRPGQAVVTLLGKINSFISEVCSDMVSTSMNVTSVKNLKLLAEKMTVDICRHSHFRRRLWNKYWQTVGLAVCLQ